MVKNGKLCKYVGENVIWLMTYCFPKRINVLVMMYKFISIETVTQVLVVCCVRKIEIGLVGLVYRGACVSDKKFSNVWQKS